MRFQIKVEYGKERFIKFYTDADITDGVVKQYSFHELEGDIKKRCNSLRHRALRIRYRDEDGDFVNLSKQDTDNFNDIFIRASSAEGCFRRIRLQVSELDSPTVYLESGPDKNLKRWQARLNPPQETARQEGAEHFPLKPARSFGPSSLEHRFESVASSSVASERSPLDHVKEELTENVKIKQVLLLSAEEELRKLISENESLTPLSAVRARVCGNCHRPGHLKPKCTASPCQSHGICGLRDKHPELKGKISSLQKEIKRLQQAYRDAESKLRAFTDARNKASTSFFAVMRPRLKVHNLVKYSDRAQLDRDLLILSKALNGKIPDFDVSQDWRLPTVIEQYRNRNISVYLNNTTGGI